MFRKSTITLLAVALAGLGIAGVSAVGASANGPQSTAGYSSLVSPYSATNLPNDWWGLSFDGTNATELGAKITLASPSPLTSATVILDSQAVGTGTFLVPITFTIYKPGTTGGSVGAVLASETKTFSVPYDKAASPTECAAGTASIFPGYLNNGTQWFDSTTGSCYYGVTYAATFSNFTFFPAHSNTLPTTVVYGVSYGTGTSTTGGASSLNVLFSTESQSGGVTAGVDTDPGNLFVAAGSGSNDLGGSTGEITCSTVAASAAFAEYNTAVGASGCGTDVSQTPSTPPYEAMGFVPAVEIF
jgi:hypothetical protein